MFERRCSVIAFLVFADGFLVRADYRRDAASEPCSRGPLGAADLRRSRPTALVSAMWVFGNKKETW